MTFVLVFEKKIGRFLCAIKKIADICTQATCIISGPEKG